MPLQELVPGPNPARDDVQQTTFGYDVMPRYICNNWQEITASQGAGSYPFDVVVIGGGMYGNYIAEKLYRRGGSAALRVLLLEAGAFLLQSHIQNLPQQLGGKIGGPNYTRMRDDASGTQNVIWGMPWISNQAFPGLAYCGHFSRGPMATPALPPRSGREPRPTLSAIRPFSMPCWPKSAERCRSAALRRWERLPWPLSVLLLNPVSSLSTSSAVRPSSWTLSGTTLRTIRPMAI